MGADTVAPARPVAELGQYSEGRVYGPARGGVDMARRAAEGWDVFTSIPRRTDAVVVTRPGAAPEIMLAVPAGSAAVAAKRTKAAKRAARDARTAKRAALASMHVATPARRAEVVRLATEQVERATERVELATRLETVARAWSDVQDARPELAVSVPAESWETRTVPADCMPRGMADKVRVHADRAPSDPVGARAAKYADTARAMMARGHVPYESTDSEVAYLVNSEILRDETRAKLWRDMPTGREVWDADKLRDSAARAAARAADKVARRRASRAAARAAR
jgi:hypothetical protein